MNEYLSKKLSFLSAVLILMVLFIHSYYTEGAQFQTLLFIENTIGSGICSIAVPLFYVISGYLFFLKMPDGMKSIGEKLKKRCHTLLIPYLIANILTFVFYAILNIIAWKVSAIDNVVNFKVLESAIENGVWDTLILIFINPPIAFQLWFVRDLMVVMLFSPIIYLILKFLTTFKLGSYLFIAIFVCCVIFPFKLPFIIAFLWFSMGGLIAIGKFDITKTKYNIYLLSALLLAYLSIPICISDNLIPYQWNLIIPLIGIPAIWMLYDATYKHAPSIFNNKATLLFTKYTFFVYLCHEPLLNIFKKLPLLIDRSETTLILCYLLAPIIFYATACCGGYCIKRIFPNLYSIYTGGR